MARIEFDASALEAVGASLSKAMAAVSSPEADGVLQCAAERMAEYLRGSLETLKLRDTGELIESIKPTAVKEKGGSKHVDIYPHGYRKDPRNGKKVRNAQVGFVHEHGNSSNPATHWMSDTADDVGDEIAGMLAEGISEIMGRALR